MCPTANANASSKRQQLCSQIVLHILFFGIIFFLPSPSLCRSCASILIVSINPPNAWQYMFYCTDLWDHQSRLAMHSTEREHGVQAGTAHSFTPHHPHFIPSIRTFIFLFCSVRCVFPFISPFCVVIVIVVFLILIHSLCFGCVLLLAFSFLSTQTFAPCIFIKSLRCCVCECAPKHREHTLCRVPIEQRGAMFAHSTQGEDEAQKRERDIYEYRRMRIKYVRIRWKWMISFLRRK